MCHLFVLLKPLIRGSGLPLRRSSGVRDPQRPPRSCNSAALIASRIGENVGARIASLAALSQVLARSRPPVDPALRERHRGDQRTVAAIRVHLHEVEDAKGLVLVPEDDPASIG